jgi:hypothetical protein
MSSFWQVWAAALGGTLGHMATAWAQEPGQSSSENAVSWHPGSAFSLSGGTFRMPKNETDRWKERAPLFFHLQQTFTVSERGGEWGVGGVLQYSSAGGKVQNPNTPQTTSAPGSKRKSQNVSYDYFSVNLALAVDYRLALMERQPVAPRITVFGGVSSQAQRTLRPDFTTKSEQFYKPIWGVRGQLEFSLIALNPTEGGALTYGYGVHDLVLLAGSTFLQDPAPKRSYKSRGFSIEVGVGFLFW